MIILGIETSCDETAAALVADGKRILSSVVSSQIDVHHRFGGGGAGTGLTKAPGGHRPRDNGSP